MSRDEATGDLQKVHVQKDDPIHEEGCAICDSADPPGSVVGDHAHTTKERDEERIIESVREEELRRELAEHVGKTQEMEKLRENRIQREALDEVRKVAANRIAGPVNEYTALR